MSMTLKTDAPIQRVGELRFTRARKENARAELGIIDDTYFVLLFEADDGSCKSFAKELTDRDPLDRWSLVQEIDDLAYTSAAHAFGHVLEESFEGVDMARWSLDYGWRVEEGVPPRRMVVFYPPLDDICDPKAYVAPIRAKLLREGVTEIDPLVFDRKS